jgi:hypothetical protein
MSEKATKLKEQPGGGEVAAVIHDLLNWKPSSPPKSNGA